MQSGLTKKVFGLSEPGGFLTIQGMCPGPDWMRDIDACRGQRPCFGWY